MRHNGLEGLQSAMRVLFDTRVGANVSLVVEGDPKINEKVHSSILAVRAPHLASFFRPVRIEDEKAGGSATQSEPGADEEDAGAAEGEEASSRRTGSSEMDSGGESTRLYEKEE